MHPGGEPLSIIETSVGHVVRPRQIQEANMGMRYYSGMARVPDVLDGQSVYIGGVRLAGGKQGQDRSGTSC